MADDGSRSEPVALSESAFDFSLRSPRFDEVEDVVYRYVRPHRLNPSSRVRKLDGQLSIHGQKDFGTFTVRYGAEVTVQLHPVDWDSDGRLAFIMAQSGAGYVRMEGQEHALTADQGTVIPAGPETFLHYANDCETLALLLSRRKLAEQCAKLLGREFVQPIEFSRQMPLENAAGQSWLRLVRYAADELSHPLSLTRQMPAAAQQLEQMMISTLLLGHSHNYSAALLQPQSAAAPYYVKRAEAHMEAHFAEPLSLADIAAHAGVSARSLQNGFQNFRNMTPMAFLRLVRLRRAQEALLRADPVFAKVTEIALSCGFSHMGEFAVLYKRTFGETPKQTLSKSLYR